MQVWFAFGFAVLYGAIPDIVWGGQWLAGQPAAANRAARRRAGPELVA
nr:hypothetical protein [uncultured Rhodopila sp.]